MSKYGASWGGIYCDRPVRMRPMRFSSSNCFAWKIPSRDKSSRLLRNSSSSHLRMDKSDSTDVEFGKTVASPAQKRRSWWNRAPSSKSHTSLNAVVWSCWSMIDAMLFSLWYAMSSSRWLFSITLLWSSIQAVACSCAMRDSITSEMNVEDHILTRSIGMRGGARLTIALLARSRSALTLAMSFDMPITKRAIVRRTIVLSLVLINSQCAYVRVPRSSTYSRNVISSTNESSLRT